MNNTIADNTSAVGSGIFADGFDAQTLLVNNIIVATSVQAAVFCGGLNDSNPPIFQFNDVFAPSGTRYGGICADQTGLSGNISADPLFVNAAGGDYHLRAASPAVDAGTNSAPGLLAADIDGDARILDGDGNGLGVVDMGADEFTTDNVQLTEVSPAKLWVGLKNSDDVGAAFDLRVELRRGRLVTSGLTRCVKGLVRNPSNAKEVTVPFDPFDAVGLSGRVLTIAVLARIGTGEDGTRCAGSGRGTAAHWGCDSTTIPRAESLDSTPRSPRFLPATCSSTRMGVVARRAVAQAPVSRSSSWMTWRPLRRAPSAGIPGPSTLGAGIRSG